jgi:hypothetical protein
MKVLIKKEIRLLLPGFIACCLFALPNLFFRFKPDGSLENGGWFVLAFVFSGLMAVMLALNSFGAEIGSGTFSNLLAQPISRQKIWDTKISLLAGSLLVAAIFWSACGMFRLRMVGHDLHLLDLFTGMGAFGLVVFSGGLWTTLLLRQVAPAFWFTLIVPGALLAIVAGLCAGSSDEFVIGMVVSVLGIYSLAGFFFARWLFFRAQDVQWTGGTIVLPEWRGLARFKASAGQLRQWRPNVALWWKEIRLHESQFVIAFALAMLHLGVLAVRHFSDLQNSRDLKFVLESFWWLWVVMPVLVGCTAVAEERKIGTHPGQLCLPVKPRTQFLIKLLVVLGLSVLFGVFMPLLLESGRILPEVHFGSSAPAPGTNLLLWGFLQLFRPFLPLLALVLISAGIGLVSFYVSTMTRNTLQCLAPAVVGVLMVWALMIALSVPWDGLYPALWHGPLGFFFVPPVLAATLLVLAHRNFQRVLVDWKLAARNVLAVLAVILLGVVATALVYNRFWEKFTPFEPRHGAARLSLANPAAFDTDRTVNSVHLPDGEIWMGALGPAPATPLGLRLGNFKMALIGESYAPGTNWVSVKSSYLLTAGLKKDGTLWVSTNSPPSNDRWDVNEVWRNNPNNMAQYGSETNWVSFVPLGHSLLLIKRDGTLWRLGPRDFDTRHKTWPGLLAFTPERVGTESNWAEVFRSDYRLSFRKKDGTGWISSDNWNTNGVACMEIEPGLVLCAVPGLDRGQTHSTAQIDHALPFQVGVRADGTFRIWAELREDSRHLNYQWHSADRQIGSDTNWLAVTGLGNKAITLKNDGTLWLWNFDAGPQHILDPDLLAGEVANTMPVRLGVHSDWIAISRNDVGALALAADGSLWFWPLVDARQFESMSGSRFNEYEVSPWLDISRKPQYLGNVLADRN